MLSVLPFPHPPLTRFSMPSHPPSAHALGPPPPLPSPTRYALIESQVVECRGVSGVVPPDATVRDEALRQYLVEAHALFCLFFGSIDRLLQQQPQPPPPPPPLPSEATTGPSSNPSTNLDSTTPSHDSPSAVPPSADLARACLQAFLPDFNTGGSPEPSALAFPFALSAPTPPRVRLPPLLDSLSNRLSCRQLNLPRSLTLPVLVSLLLPCSPNHPLSSLQLPHSSSSPPASSPRLPIQPPLLPCCQLNLPCSLTLPALVSLLLPCSCSLSASPPPHLFQVLTTAHPSPLIPRVRLPSLLNSLSCRQLNLPRSLTLPALVSLLPLLHTPHPPLPTSPVRPALPAFSFSPSLSPPSLSRPFLSPLQ
ncbi:unnamed protein product [Closterium sp. NIES-54]